MVVYVVSTKDKMSGNSKVSSVCYEDIQDAIDFCKKRSDYVRSKSVFVHEGAFTEYTITEARCEAKKDNGQDEIS